MLSKVEGRNYIIARDENDRFRIKVNKNKLDKYIKDLSNNIRSFNETLHHIYENESEVYEALSGYTDTFDNCYNGTNYSLQYLLESIEEFKNNLSVNDDIPELEDITTIEDIGFRLFDNSINLYEKIINTTDTEEISEEIILSKNPEYRKRTIWFEKTDYGKKSTKIEYKKLKINKKLEKIIQNTIVRMGGL